MPSHAPSRSSLSELAGALRTALVRPPYRVAATAAAFLLCFAPVVIGLVEAWWRQPEMGHAVFVAPIAIWLAATRLSADRAPRHGIGIALIAVGALAAVLGPPAGATHVARLGLVSAVLGLTLYFRGVGQLARWRLPAVLGLLCIPIPSSLLAVVTAPLQLLAAQLGAALLTMRRVPVHLEGNVIQIPGHALFVSEACSGMRSLVALLSLGLLSSALLLERRTSRVVVLLATVVVAVLVNGLRVFLTGFLVTFVSDELGQGFMHLTEGYLLFLVSLGCLYGITRLVTLAEGRWIDRSRPEATDTVSAHAA